MKSIRILWFFFLLAAIKSHGQYFQFSQYNFSAQRVNPASAGASEYAAASMLYRNQSTGGGFNLTSNLLNVSYPLIGKKNGHWAGVGLSFLDDRTGQSGIYNTQEVSGSFAVHIPVARWQNLSLGVSGLHARRRLDINGLFTGAQYIEGRGFDRGIEHGEPLGNLQNNFFTFSSGIHWNQTDKVGNKLAHFGFSFFDINRPDESFLDRSHAYASTFVITGSVVAIEKDMVRFSPEALYTRNAGRNILNAGFITSYELNRYKDKPSDRIDILTKYVIARSGIVGIQFHKENISMGLSYDFPVFKRNVANTGTVEAGIELRRLVSSNTKSRRKRLNDRNSVSLRKTPAKTQNKTVLPKQSFEKDTVAKSGAQNEISKRLKHKQDSVYALVNAGKLEHEALVLEETTLRFGFDFNRSELDQSSRIYLDELAVALIDNPELRIELTGHTDNVGSVRFNVKLSVERALTLKNELVERGVDPDRIKVEGKGMSEPLNRNDTEEQRAENRRVEMKIYYMD